MKMDKKTRIKTALIVLAAVVALVAVKVLTAQFLYTEIGYSPAATEQEYRNALSVSPFTATAFQNGYTYEYDGRQINNIEELEKLYIEKGATEMYVRIATGKSTFRASKT